MWKSGVVALLAAVVLNPCIAQTDEFDQGMNTMWEVLWHQSGIPTRLVRWEGDITVRISGVNLATHRQHTLQALRDAAAEAGVKLTDVTDQPGAPANVTIDIVANQDLSENQPCETQLHYATETRLDKVEMKMRDSDAQRCAYHESMHAMGVRGHPEGHTVLSYFAGRSQGLQPLDK